ncbi:hypothetical protein FRC05_005650 [Tulasnella sp. 425]|nr:hypothetical protein FRC05_005650 [Tulasnella sp. 425]
MLVQTLQRACNTATTTTTGIYTTSMNPSKMSMIESSTTPSYFQDPRDVFLTSLTDGFQLFKRSRHTAWPLLFLNNNLSPDCRFKLSSVICSGLIPGLRKPKDHDSFTYVFVEELNQAALGVSAYDAYADELFDLRIFAHLNCTDMSGVASAYTGGKHPGAKVPCHFCPIVGIRIQNTSNLSFYLPLKHPAGYPSSQFTIDNLPLRTPRQYRFQARKVDLAPTVEQRKQLSMRYGINGTPIMSKAPGVILPFSSPFNFMHLLENMCSNYVDHICGEFKGLDAGRESYILPTLRFGRRLAKQLSMLTPPYLPRLVAVFSMSRRSAPISRASLTLYGVPSMPLSSSGIVSLDQSITPIGNYQSERDRLREDIKKWYREYEEIFYQRRTERLAACVVTVHAWLQLVDMMEQSGPLWAYWCWVMERFCGHLARAISSRKHPYASLNRRIHEIQSLHAIRHIYRLEAELPPYTAMYDSADLPRYEDLNHYPEITLLHPRRVLSFEADDLDDLHR